MKGDSCVPFNEGELGWWVNTQRQNKRKGKLVPHREALLDKADFVWNPQEFLAARRRHHAALRASTAHAIAANDQYYRQSSNVQQPSRLAPHAHHPVSPLQYEGIGGTITENTRKRRPVPSSFYCNESVIGECEVSPTSVKRPKFAISPITPTKHMASWPMYPSSTPLSQATPNSMHNIKQETSTSTNVWGSSFYQLNTSTTQAARSTRNNTKAANENGSQAVPRATSIASLLSPVQANSLLNGENYTRAEWKSFRKSEATGLEVLSSVAVSSQSVRSSTAVKLPPISALSSEQAGADRT